MSRTSASADFSADDDWAARPGRVVDGVSPVVRAVSPDGLRGDGDDVVVDVALDDRGARRAGVEDVGGSLRTAAAARRVAEVDGWLAVAGGAPVPAAVAGSADEPAAAGDGTGTLGASVMSACAGRFADALPAAVAALRASSMRTKSSSLPPGRTAGSATMPASAAAARGART
jgi:hypothetical protein